MPAVQSNVNDSAMLSLCRTDEVGEGEAIRVEPDGLPPLAVFKVEGEFFVTDDTCTHGEASLSEGSIEGGSVECPWHSGRFCLKTGAAQTFPAVTDIRVYASTVVEGRVCIHAAQRPA